MVCSGALLEIAFSKQRRRCRSGWSGLGRTTFQWVIGLVPRLQRQSEAKTIGPGVPRKLAFALRVYAFLVIIPALLLADQEPGAS